MIESFINFIRTEETSGSRLTREIVNKLTKAADLLLSDCRGQSYENCADVLSKYQSVQARTLQLIDSEKCLSCGAHPQNLVGVYASFVTSEIIIFQDIKNFLTIFLDRQKVAKLHQI